MSTLKDLNNSPTNLPILPRPTIPTVFPERSCPIFLFHLPLRIFRSIWLICRKMSNIKPTVNSATARVGASGVFLTKTLLALAASISILSKPVPHRLMTRRLGSFSRISLLYFSVPATIPTQSDAREINSSFLSVLP